MAESRSVLETQLRAPGRHGAGGQGSLRIVELRGWQLCQIAAGVRTDDALRVHLQALGVPDLPREGGRVLTAGDERLYRLSPARYLWLAPSEALMQHVAQELDPAIGSVTLLSSARVRLAVEGPRVQDALARGIALDLHPAVFAVGQFAQTGVHHVPVLLERVREQCFELQVPTTWAVSVWEWLTDAALPFGYHIATEPASAIVTA